MMTFGTVHTLDLSCTKVVDVSALGNVHTLNLSCTEVTDVRAHKTKKRTYKKIRGKPYVRSTLPYVHWLWTSIPE